MEITSTQRLAGGILERRFTVPSAGPLADGASSAAFRASRVPSRSRAASASELPPAFEGADAAGWEAGREGVLFVRPDR